MRKRSSWPNRFDLRRRTSINSTSAFEAMLDQRIDKHFIEEANSRFTLSHKEELTALGALLHRRGLNLERVIRQAARFSVALPSWGFRQGGTRFGRFARKGEPETLEEKMLAAALVNDLTGIAPRISLHIPWDTPEPIAVTRKL